MSSTTRSTSGIALANRLAWIDYLRTAMILLGEHGVGCR
jgi:hypothetical protein